MPDPVTSAQLHTLWALPELRLDATSAPGTRAEAPHEELALTSAELAELFARIVWSRITEPGDATAGTLIAWLGAPAALALVARGAHPREFDERFLRTEAPLGSAAAGEPPSGPAITAALRRWRPRIADTPASSDIERAVELGMRVVTPTHPAWPQQLNDLGAHTPHLLWVRGNPTHLSAPSLAIVGARACTSYGAHVTAELAAAAVAGGRVIVSGAAYGVDAVAHRTALAAERPTVAVLAGGADRVYPAAHDTLLARVREQGVVCSELVPGAAPTRWRFLQRNRLIAALADATLVTEAGPRSGSLNTAGQPARVLLYVRCLLISWVGCTVPAQQRLARPRRSGSAAAGHQRSRPNASGRTSAASCRSTSGGTGKRALQQTQQQAQPRAQQRPRSGSAVVAARQHSKHRRDTPERSFLL
ncbi:DNA-processing protein DprA [Leucobacter chromiireducens subsp. chromiireducens]|uniref:DNA-processing protein DprA n=2 Tax=Leucobacter TaxID=55968 RepID=A0ABS1SMR6_9MICO|nr:DNA-processing protein DprA [Leucobacter chromiireducens]MBL3689463.1 DNA-processing protein DprA [Leucobacter chromiireducens subsp. chromiireducens]